MAFQLQLRSGALALREGRAPVRERLTAMVLLMALLHAIVLLGLTFTGTSRAGKDDTPQLDVLLVTDQVAQAAENEHAAYLAQRTQLGSGNTAQAAPPASPSSRGASAAATEPSAERERRRGAEALDQRVLTTSAANSEIRYIGTLPAGGATASSTVPSPVEGEPRSGRGDALELMLRGPANAEHWVAPDTKASKLAPYLAVWKRKVERVGTLNFPSAARSAGLSGSPVLEVEIAADGSLRQARVRRSSGYGALDEAALTILKLASPFDPFPAALSAEYSRLRFAYQWDFVSGSLATGAVTASSDKSGGP